MSDVSSKADAHAQEEHEHYDPEGNKIGMWLFLFTELILFGALFITYTVYLQMYTKDFRNASKHLDKILGATNTIILLTSSLTMVLSIVALRKRNVARCIQYAWVTIGFAGAFLVVKYFEWGHKFDLGIYPPAWSKGSDTFLAGWISAPSILGHGKVGEQIYFGLYYAMTGLHALHIVIGGGLILWAIGAVKKGRTTPDRIDLLENVGLYWHLVDLIWIFLFPFFYLIH